MYVSFEIAALLSSPYRREKKRGNIKINTLVDSIESFLYCLGSKEIADEIEIKKCKNR